MKPLWGSFEQHYQYSTLPCWAGCWLGEELWILNSVHLPLQSSWPKPGDHSSCCTRPPGQSWPRWEKQGWGWGWWACRPAGRPTPPPLWCSWRRSAYECGWCSSPPADSANSSWQSGTSSLCRGWRYGTHWGSRQKDKRKGKKFHYKTWT